MSSFPRYRVRSRWREYITPAVRNIVLACVGVFLIQTLLQLFSPQAYYQFNRTFGLVPFDFLFKLHVWQPVTYLFLHGGLWHILLNMLFLWMFGVDLERTWGSRRFYEYFFLTGIGAACINVLAELVVHPGGSGASFIPTIGASGAIYGILLANAVMFPDRKIWLIPFPVQIPMKIYVIAAGAIEFFMTLGAGGGDNVSHVTHLGGMLVGYLYLRRGSWFFRARNGISDWQRKRARRKFEVYMRKHREEPPSRPDHWVN
jgi:membrane associated rhomboid family serine protease